MDHKEKRDKKIECPLIRFYQAEQREDQASIENMQKDIDQMICMRIKTEEMIDQPVI
jgi:hypothetical protein